MLTRYLWKLWCIKSALIGVIILQNWNWNLEIPSLGSMRPLSLHKTFDTKWYKVKQSTWHRQRGAQASQHNSQLIGLWKTFWPKLLTSTFWCFSTFLSSSFILLLFSHGVAVSFQLFFLHGDVKRVTFPQLELSFLIVCDWQVAHVWGYPPLFFVCRIALFASLLYVKFAFNLIKVQTPCIDGFIFWLAEWWFCAAFLFFKTWVKFVKYIRRQYFNGG